MANGTALPESSPEAQGISSAAIRAFVDAADRQALGLHSVELLRNGHVVAAGWWRPYAPERPHMLYSLSKSFASTGIGLLADAGRLSLDDRVLQFFADDAPTEIGPNLAAMRVRDLLAMATGHHADVTQALRDRADGDWIKAFLAQPVEHEPGTHFAYNSAATFMLSAIVQKLTGDTLLAFLEPRLLAPLGIAGATWESNPQGINVGGWGMSITTDDIARFGQLYLQRGVWQGRRLLSEEWVAQATSAQVSNASESNVDWRQGYGFQFWRCRHNAYRGDGAFGQFCVVMPDQGAVLAITSGTPDMQAVLNAVWEHLLPAFKPEPLPEDPDALAALRRTLAGLTLPGPAGDRSSPEAARHAGAYRFAPNDQGLESAAFDFAEGVGTLILRMAGDDERLACGADAWLPGESRLLLDGRGVRPAAPRGARPVAARGAWADASTFVATLCFVETPYIATATCRFEGDRVHVDIRTNVSFVPTERPTLVGERVA
jgi:CubicO group peptidase (beta-lactamase class C family)